ncbi:Secreted RxLR effector peptide protein [Phytophthora palmivora]|uniref:RxLR effector protein n=1 Tax=Phytophthora palmivora TaxID=4796 RepID=A0A2P4X7G0_9STRA|nr:Secreted RxLR effector peptide protein [Phytophthora palmivora]
MTITPHLQMRLCYVLFVVAAAVLVPSEVATTANNAQVVQMASTQGSPTSNAPQKNGIQHRFLRGEKNTIDQAEERTLSNLATLDDLMKIDDLLSVKSTKKIDKALIDKGNHIFNKMLNNPKFREDIFSKHITDADLTKFNAIWNLWRTAKGIKFDTEEVVKAVRNRPSTI